MPIKIDIHANVNDYDLTIEKCSEIISILQDTYRNIRKEIVEENRLEAVISMPSGVFKPYAGVSTAILIFTKPGMVERTKSGFMIWRQMGVLLMTKGHR